MLRKAFVINSNKKIGLVVNARRGTSINEWMLESELYKIEIFIKSFRIVLIINDLPFIAGKLSESDPKRAAFNQMLKHLPERVNRTYVVVADDLKTTDRSHFNSAGQRILGERYAKAILNLI